MCLIELNCENITQHNSLYFSGDILSCIKILIYTPSCIAWSRSNIDKKKLFLNNRHNGKFSYERPVYESVNDMSLSLVISQKSTENIILAA